MPDDEAVPAYELYGQLPLSRTTIDRAAERRTDQEWLDAAWRDPHTRVLVVADGTAAVDDSGLVLLSPAEAPSGERYLLGADGDTAYFAVRPSGAHPDRRAVTLRQAGGLLSDRDAGLMVHAVALANWHTRHGYCAQCGTPTELTYAGHVRRCPADGSEHYPRTDPAVIVLVTDKDDRCLLGRGANWPPDRYSTLAGFVEPGETPEHAVAREVYEEAGIEVDSCSYAGSQPWPFPSSLMLAYFARATGEQPRPDGDEIVDARWFSRDELGAAISSGAIAVPSTISVSRRLIEGWYGGELKP
jgi:NAD+ diphosphatase